MVLSRAVRSVARFVVLCGAALVAGCGGGPTPPAPVPEPTAAPATTPAAPEPTAPSGAPAASAAPSAADSATPAAPPDSAAGNTYAAHVDEAKLAQELGADNGKLLTIAKLSPKTHKSLIKIFLWKAASECKGQALVEVKPAPGLLVAAGKPLQVNAKAYESLKAAGVLAQQRGMAIEVVTGAQSIKDAVKAWNHAIIEMALVLVKAAPPADQKEKSFAGEARKQIDDGEGPKSWSSDPCTKGRFGGFAVDVQLVALDAAGKRGQVLVKAGADGDRFTKESFESTYWDKPKGKSFRTLTEIMSAGSFVRECASAFHFSTAPGQDGTWRCKQDTESWDPPNRLIPAWQ